MPSPRDLVATPYRRGVLVLAIITLCWRAWTVSRWTWHNDDWGFLEDSVSMPFWSYLLQDHNGHVMPGGFFVTKLITAMAPLDFRVVVALVALVSCANVVLWGLAFERVTRGSVIALMPLAVLALSPIAVEPMMWWACSVNALPLQMTLAWLVLLACRWVEARRMRDIAWLGIAFFVGLFFWHKSVFLVLPTTVTVLALAPGTLRERARASVPPLVTLLAIALPYLGLFRFLTSRVSESYDLEPTFEGHSFGGSLMQYARGFSDMFLPGLLGGPWGSMQVDQDPFSTPSKFVTGTVITISAVALVWLLARKPRLAWLLLLPLVYTLVTLGIVMFSTRADDIWDVMVTERYHVDGIVVAMLTAALMIGAWHHSDADDFPSAHPRKPMWVVCMAALSLSLIVSNVWAAQRLGVHPGKQWVSDVRTDLSADGPITIWDGFPPDEVLSAVYWGEDARFSRMFLPMAPQVSTTRATSQLTFVDPEGRLHPTTVDVKTQSTTGPDEGCGWSISPGQSVTVDLDVSLFSWDWLVQVNTLAASDGVLTITVGDTTRTLRADSGLHQQQFQVRGEVPEQVEVTMIDGTQSLCVTDVLAGDIVY